MEEIDYKEGKYLHKIPAKLPKQYFLFEDNKIIDRELYSKKEVSILFQVSNYILRKWDREGFLCTIKVNGKVYYPVKSINKIILQSQVTNYDYDEYFKTVFPCFYTGEELKPISFYEYLKNKL